MISMKYGVDKGDWFLKYGRGAYGVGPWKEIKKETRALRDFSKFVVGDGRRIEFWEDKWCGLEPLGETFPSLYAMTSSKGPYMADF